MNCRVCGAADFGHVIDLGMMPLPNNLLEHPDDPCQRWPLRVVFCRSCSLAQLTETPPPSVMFESYSYFSSLAQTMVDHASRLVDRFVRPGDRVVEIASNDGYLLKHAKARGATILGVDPARNIAAKAIEQGIPTEIVYFDPSTARRLRESFGAPQVMFANNVLAHVPDPNAIAAGIKALLADGGVAHVEVPHLVRLIEQRAFDTIYHEHYSYFSANALRRLFRQHGLEIVGVEQVEIHGGTLHVQVAHRGDSSAIDELCDRERRAGLFTDAYYADFAVRVEESKSELLAELGRYETVAGFGAAAKATVLLNYFGLSTERIPWVADITPYKQGRHIPGTGQRIVPPDRLLTDRPEACLLFPWNLRAEIVRRNRAYVDGGGRFIVALPQVRVITSRIGPTRARPVAALPLAHDAPARETRVAIPARKLVRRGKPRRAGSPLEG
jgi:2-polyprenyl-3-methyl-5-hydroxy-6-metoxy-1,4-benzoquinol methylase